MATSKPTIYRLRKYAIATMERNHQTEYYIPSHQEQVFKIRNGRYYFYVCVKSKNPSLLYVLNASTGKLVGVPQYNENDAFLEQMRCGRLYMD